jgi:glycosyltransferase involved in cell wall biosynthesis
MKISVITPSFNQAQFLPDNILSVFNQKGVEVEHIIVDPGSTDGSIEIAKAAKHAFLINEPDRGQSHAIVKGFTQSSGDILVWLNSDDYYPNTNILSQVAAAFENNKDTDVVYGRVDFVDEKRKFLRKGFVEKKSDRLLELFQYQVGIVQPGVFMRRKVFESIGGPSESYTYCMDYEYWVRAASAQYKWTYVDELFAHHRWWPGMKTMSARGKSLVEHFKVCLSYFGYIHYKWLDRYAEFLTTLSDGVVNHADVIDDYSKRICARQAVERYVTQDMLRQLEESTEEEQLKTLDYIHEVAPGFKRHTFDTAELSEPVSTHPDPMAEQRVAWYIFDTTTPDKRNFKTYTVNNNFSRSFDLFWYNDQLERTKGKLVRLANRRKDVCVIVGNGPSLNRTNLDLLTNADVIISNYSFISQKLMKYASLLTVVNDLVAKQGSVDLNDLDITKIIPFWLANSINLTDSTYIIPATVEPLFCTEIAGTFSWRSTVSFLNMQLAFALGYKQVALIGFDHFYKQATELKEGDSIDQKDEDPNHFDPRYFQGKTWQAADTANMEKMYVLALNAFKKAGRSIVNSTDGGSLEIFPRVCLEQVLGLSDNRKLIFPINSKDTESQATQNSQESNQVAANSLVTRLKLKEAPRLLILDMTPMGDSSATGQIKSTLLSDWPAERLLQIAKQGSSGLASVTCSADRFPVKHLKASEARELINEFDPNIILYRPVPNTVRLHELAMDEIRKRDVSLVTWIMDDWPARMESHDADEWNKRMKHDWHYLLERSAYRLSISEAMSTAFKQRYEKEFIPVANGVDPDEWPTIIKPSAKDGIFRLRFAGGLAEDMNRKSLLKLATAVDIVAQSSKMRISFQIKTQDWWLEQAKGLFNQFKHTHVVEAQLGPEAYRRWISEADGVVIAYNFDSTSQEYIQYSMANKMPECLASGAQLLAIGPVGIATIDYLIGTKSATVVTEDSVSLIETGLIELIDNASNASEHVSQARSIAFDKHNLIRIKDKLIGLLLDSENKRYQPQDEFPSPVPTNDQTIPESHKSTVQENKIDLTELSDLGKVSKGISRLIRQSKVSEALTVIKLGQTKGNPIFADPFFEFILKLHDPSQSAVKAVVPLHISKGKLPPSGSHSLASDFSDFVKMNPEQVGYKETSSLLAEQSVLKVFEASNLAEAEKALPYKTKIYLPTDRYSDSDQLSGIKKTAAFLSKENSSATRCRLDFIRSWISTKGYTECIIVANGPSLKSTNLSLLDNTFLIGLNSIFLHPYITPQIIVCEDHLVGEDRSHELNQITTSVLCVPGYLTYCIDPDDNTIVLNHRPRISYPVDIDFSNDIDEVTYTGGTVTYTALQLAAGLGFRKIGLVGCDASYKVDNVETDQSYSTGILTSKSDDPNHFNSSYFGKGYRWHDPNPLRMMQAYAVAKRFADSRGVEISNYTKGGMLEVFKRESFDNLVRDKYPKVCIIDWIDIRSNAATGDVKKALFKDWPTDKILHIYSPRPSRIDAYRSHPGDIYHPDFDSLLPAFKAVLEFDPDVVYWRPTHNRPLLNLWTAYLLRSLATNYTIHLMDKWQIKVQDTEVKAMYEQVIMEACQHSSHVFVISERMKDMMTAQYGLHPDAVTVAHNYCRQPDISISDRYTSPIGKQIKTIFYSGNLDPDQSIEPLLDIAKAVDMLNNRDSDVAYKFVVQTSDYHIRTSGGLFKDFPSVELKHQSQDRDSYMADLQNSDVNILCYGFSLEAREYLSVSMANKIADLLAIDSKFIGYGDPGIGTLAFLGDVSFPFLLERRDITDLANMIRNVCALDYESFASECDHSLHLMKDQFTEMRQCHIFQSRLVETASASSSPFQESLLHLLERIYNINPIQNNPLILREIKLLSLLSSEHVSFGEVRQLIKKHSIDWSINVTKDKLKDDPLNLGYSDQSYLIAMLIASSSADRYQGLWSRFDAQF